MTVGSIVDWDVDRIVGAGVYRGVVGGVGSDVVVGFGIDYGWEVELGVGGEVSPENFISDGKDGKGGVSENIGGSVDWYTVRVVGAEFGRDVGGEVGIGDCVEV